MKRYAMIAAFILAAASTRAGEISWEKNYDDGLASAKKAKKLVMVDVYTDWCGWCKKLDKDVYTDKPVIEKVAKDFVAVKLNPESSKKNGAIAEKFGVRGYPCILFLDSDGKELSRIGGYVPAAEFARQLDAVSKKK